MLYMCTHCEYTTKDKSNYKRHLQRTNGCCVDRVRCVLCQKEMLPKNLTKHMEVCKQVPTNTCPTCRQPFDCRKILSRHKKTCGPIVNQCVTTNIQIQQNIQTIVRFPFGNENVEYLHRLRDIDERVDMVVRCLSDALDIVYFNADHPENQTIRKTHRTTQVVDMMLHNHVWNPTDVRTAATQIQENLEKHLKIKYTNTVRVSLFKDLLFAKTHRGTLSEEDILGKYNGPPLLVTENMKKFVNEVESTCNIYRSVYPNKVDFVEQAQSIREYNMHQAELFDIAHFKLRHAHAIYEKQLSQCV